jgi:ferredoxin-NADP reductase
LVEIRNFKISSIKEECEGVKTFKLEPLDGNSIVFKPGQFFMLHWKENGNFGIKRAYSVSSSPTENSFLEFTIELVGEFTHKLWELTEGMEIGVSGPFGVFTLEEKEEEIAFIAAGIGVTPFLGMLKYVDAKKFENKVTLFYSCQSRAKMAFEKELKEISSRNPSVNVVVTLTRENPGNWGGELGRIDESMLGKHLRDLNKPFYYICGSAAFAQAFWDLLVSKGIEKTRIKREGFG